MAGIEKICEYSEDYPGHLMYGYKRNHIQIMPCYRKEFKNKDALLLFFKVDDGTFYQRDRLGIFGTIAYTNTDKYQYIDRQWYKWVKDRNNTTKEIAKRIRKVPYYEYALIVPELPGRVNGVYMNHSFDKGAVIRKLKNMVGKKLKIGKIDMTFDEWRDIYELPK